jgi:hypothetical protein
MQAASWPVTASLVVTWNFSYHGKAESQSIFPKQCIEHFSKTKKTVHRAIEGFLASIISCVSPPSTEKVG